MQFVRNTRNARIRAGFNDAKEFARLLGVPYHSYSKYETRTPLPHFFIPLFSQLTRTSIKSMFEINTQKISLSRARAAGSIAVAK